eukprot:scaffold165926_cov27-Tisochrysis_lutea.AAC.3
MYGLELAQMGRQALRMPLPVDTRAGRAGLGGSGGCEWGDVPAYDRLRPPERHQKCHGVPASRMRRWPDV